jgi:hypothetical protein
MLIILVVVKVPTVLLDIGVDSKRAGVNSLDTKVKGFEPTTDFTFLLAIAVLNPDFLDIGTTNDVIPV